MFFTRTQGIILSALTMILGVVSFLYFAPAEWFGKEPQIATVVASSGVEGNQQVQLPVQKIENKEPFVIALLGTDQRKDETARTDTIMIIRYDMENQKASIVSIPRDSLVDLPGYHKDKVNAAHAYGGVPLTLETLEEALDIDIDYYAKVNFEGFKQAIKVLGGVEVNAKKDIDYEGIHIDAGEQVLEGDELLMYVRFRKDKDGDFGRIERQQEVMKSLVGDLLKPSNLIKLPKFMSIFKEHVDTDVDIQEIITLAMETKNFDKIVVDSHTLKTVSDKVDGIWYEIIDEEDLQAKSNLLNGLDPSIEEGVDFPAETEEEENNLN